MSKQQNTDDQMITLVDENGNEQLLKSYLRLIQMIGENHIFLFIQLNKKMTIQ